MAGGDAGALGDRVRIRVESWKGEVEHEGMLMPAAAEGHVTIKLVNGYNISFSESSVQEMIRIGGPLKFAEEVLSAAQDESLPKVTIIHTGGTIASKVDYKTGAVVARFEPEELLAENPELRAQACISTLKLGNMWSDDMRTQHWNAMLEATSSAFESGAVGVVICQGTDTMHYSSAAVALGWCGSGGIPPGRIVFTGSQRSSDRGSTDAYENLLAAVHWAAHGPAVGGDAGDGTVLVMHAGPDDGLCAVWPGIAVRKLHTSRRDAFQGINAGPLANISIDRGKAQIEPIAEMRGGGRERISEPEGFDCDIKISHLIANAHLDASLVDHCREAGHAGLVLHGTGLGHLPIEDPMGDSPENLLLAEALRNYVDTGGIAVVVAQCIHGGIDLNVYSKGRNQQELGLLGHGANTSPETLAVKLHWLLSQPKATEDGWVADRLKVNLCGEDPEVIKE